MEASPVVRFLEALQDAREAAKATWPEVGEDQADLWRASVVELIGQVEAVEVVR